MRIFLPSGTGMPSTSKVPPPKESRKRETCGGSSGTSLKAARHRVVLEAVLILDLHAIAAQPLREVESFLRHEELDLMLVLVVVLDFPEAPI